MPTPDPWLFNYNHVYGIDCLDADGLTRTMIEGRETAFEFLDHLRRTVPGCERAHMAATAPLPGVRETRRIVADFTLTADAYFRSERHEDDVCVYDYALDLHAARASTESQQGQELYYGRRTQPGEFFGVPYRSLLPAGVENLCAAGRCIGCDRAMLASVRVMTSSFATGQAAGTAAALALGADGRFRAVEPGRLRACLTADGSRVAWGGRLGTAGHELSAVP